MPAPAALLVAAGITAVASNPVFIHFVYNPLIAPTLERLAENYIEQRRGRSRRPADPVDGLPQPEADDRNGIPLNGIRRSSYENGDGDEELGLLMVQTAREPDENVDANMTLRRRPVAAVPVVDNTILEELSLLLEFQDSESTTDREHNENADADATLHRRTAITVPVVDDTILEESSFLPAVQSSTTAREPDENVDAEGTLHKRPAAAVLVDRTTHEESSSLLIGVQGSTTARELNANENIDSTATLHRRPVSIGNNCRFGSERQTPLVSIQDKKLRPRPTIAVGGLSLPVVPEWKTTVSQDPLGLQEERRRKDQVQWMSSIVDRRSPFVVPAVPAVSTAPVPSSLPTLFYVSEELNPDTLPQICPTDLITNASVPSTLSSTTSSARNVVFTPPSQVSPLFSGSIDPWNGVSVSPLTMQDGGLDVPVSVSSVTHSAPSLQTNASGDSSSTSEFSLLHNVPRAPPQLPPLPTFSPLCVPSMSLSLSTHSIQSNQLTSPTSPGSPTLQSPPQSSNTPLHFTSSAQHRNCVHHSAALNRVATVHSSKIYQQRRFASPGVMSSELSELDFSSE